MAATRSSELVGTEESLSSRSEALLGPGAERAVACRLRSVHVKIRRNRMDGQSRIDSHQIRRDVEELTAQIEEGAVSPIVFPRVSTRLVQNVEAESRFLQYERDFEFRCDESVARGGRGASPSPMRYFLSGVAFCYQVWWAKSAALAGQAITDLTVDVVTQLDMRGELAMVATGSHPEWIAFDVVVSGPTDAPTAMLIADAAGQRCPLTALLSRTIPVFERLTFDGVVIRDSTDGRLELG